MEAGAHAGLANIFHRQARRVYNLALRVETSGNYAGGDGYGGFLANAVDCFRLLRATCETRNICRPGVPVCIKGPFFLRFPPL